MACDPTNDHVYIRRWAEMRGAEPAERLPLHVDGEEPVLSLRFRDETNDGGRHHVISWEHFFDRFDMLDLSFFGGDGSGLEWREYKILSNPTGDKPTGLFIAN